MNEGTFFYLRLKIKICLFGIADRLTCFDATQKYFWPILERFFLFTWYVWHFDSLRFRTFRSILIRCVSMCLLEINWMLANNQCRIFLRFIQASNNESRPWITKCEPRNKQCANLHNELHQWLKNDKMGDIGKSR